MQHATARTKAARHPFETAAGETFFKALLWIMLILQVAVFTRMYQNVVHALPQRPTHSTHQP